MDWNKQIKKYESDKDNIEIPLVSQEEVLAPPIGSHLFVGRSGTGKSNLLANILLNPNLFGGYFDSTILISPTCENDSIQQQLKVNTQLCFSNLRAAPVIIDKLLNAQKKAIKEKGSDKAPKVCLVLDDVMSCADLMKSPQFLSLFTLGRHANLGIFCCIQTLKSRNAGFPRAALLNCSELFCFASSAAEIAVLADDFTPPLCDKHLFEKWIFESTKVPFTFIHLNNRSSSFENRYRAGLDNILQLDTIRRKENGGTALSTPSLGVDEKGTAKMDAAAAATQRPGDDKSRLIRKDVT